MGSPGRTFIYSAIIALATIVAAAGAFSATASRVTNGSEPRTLMAGSIKEVTATTNSIAAAKARPAITRRALRNEELAARMDFEVALKMRNFAELEGRLARGERISAAEMGQRYYPLAADYEAAVAWLVSQGLTVTRQDSSRLLIFASGSVVQVQSAFQVTCARVAFAGEEHTSALTAPSVPTSIAAPILGINGLQPHLHAFKHARPLAPRPADATSNNPPYFPSQIATAYNAVPATLGVNGAGQTIAIVIDTFPNNSDLTSFWSLCNVPQSLSNIQEVQVVSGTLAAPSGEETLDVEWSSSMAPAATVRVYATLDLADVHLDAAYTQIFQDVSTGKIRGKIPPVLHRDAAGRAPGKGGVFPFPTGQADQDAKNRALPARKSRRGRSPVHHHALRRSDGTAHCIAHFPHD